MWRLAPGWLVALCGAIVSVSAWLPWLTAADGRVSAIGGVVGELRGPAPGFGVGQLLVLLASMLIVAGAMAARGLSPRMASSAALALSVLLVVLSLWYYRLYVYPPVSAGYGLYLGAAVGLLAVLLSVWTMVAAWATLRNRTSPTRNGAAPPPRRLLHPGHRMAGRAVQPRDPAGPHGRTG